KRASAPEVTFVISITEQFPYPGVCTTYTRRPASQPLRSAMPLTHDLRYALRLLTRSRISTILAILSLALGIGATTAIFSVVYAVLIDPSPYAAADRIGFAHILTAKDDDRGDPPYTMPEFQEIKASSKSIEDMI